MAEYETGDCLKCGATYNKFGSQIITGIIGSTYIQGMSHAPIVDGRDRSVHIDMKIVRHILFCIYEQNKKLTVRQLLDRMDLWNPESKEN